jgi:hypothetical protein
MGSLRHLITGNGNRDNGGGGNNVGVPHTDSKVGSRSSDKVGSKSGDSTAGNNTGTDKSTHKDNIRRNSQARTQC